jgi:hypothetical protein
VAGVFYPADPGDLARTVDALLDAAAGPPGRAAPVALVAPHAGYVYSGPVAASAYALVRGTGVERVAVLGPAHFVPLRGFAVPGVDAWRTPLGDVALDEDLRPVATAAGAVVDDGPHEPEHSIEVQLPFLLRALGDRVRVLPVAVGATPHDAVAELVGALAPNALVVVSTDLSHYHDAETARALDRRTADAVLGREPEAIGAEDACGVFALRGFAAFARRADLAVELLDLRNSADTAGDPRRVVGYGAFALVARQGPPADVEPFGRLDTPEPLA